MENILFPFWMEIDAQNLHNNVEVLKRWSPSSSLMAVVKSEAYGHGWEAVNLLYDYGLRKFGVASVEEAHELRKRGIKGDIYLLGGFFTEEAEMILEDGLTPVVSSPKELQALEELARKADKVIPFHLKVDTGMGRMGFLPQEINGEWWKRWGNNCHLSLRGVMTHFASAESDPAYTHFQFDNFLSFLGRLPENNPSRERHCCNSAAFLAFPEMHLDLSRVGIAFWGVSPWGRKATLPLDLKPVMRIKARVKQVKTLPPGSSVGYGGTFTTSRETKIAIISIGYSQGLFRSLSNRMEVLVRGKRAPSRGNISMDQMTVEVTGIEGVEKGDIATVVGKEGKEEVTIEEIADLAHTVPHEVLCSLGKIKNRMIYENHCSLAK